MIRSNKAEKQIETKQPVIEEQDQQPDPLDEEVLRRTTRDVYVDIHYFETE